MLFCHFAIICIGFALSCQGVIELRQTDFDEGTYILNQPGEYKLMEDIVFNPNSVSSLGVSSYEAGDILPSQFTFGGGKYDPAAYGLGFFAAIAVSADNAVLDLNGHTISQHPEHALQQRFFAIIELADRPFMPSQGPHNFGSALIGAKNTIIKNGKLGLNSHHGIHGNNPYNVTLQNLDISQYEVAAIALNGGAKNKIKDVRSLGSREDVPVYGTFSSARFLRRYVNYLRDIAYEGTLTVQGKELSISDIYEALKTSLNNAYEDIITNAASTGGKIDPVAHPDEYALYHNNFGIIDGTSYGILLNKLGVAVNGFPYVPEEDAAESISLKNVEVRNHVAVINEVITLRSGEEDKPVIDPVGAVFQVFNRHPDTDEYITISNENINEARYLGNALANAQAFVAKAAIHGAFEGSRIDVSRSAITEELLEWIEADSSSEKSKLGSYIAKHPLLCDGDSMVHANKGTIGVKIDGTLGVRVSNVQVYNITNYGKLGSTLCDYDTTTISNPFSTLPGYQGATSRGFSFSGSVDVRVSNAHVEYIQSMSGSACAFDVLLDSHDISITDSFVDNIIASVNQIKEDFTGPNAVPECAGCRAPETSSRIRFENIDTKGNLINNAGGDSSLVHDLSISGSSLFSSDDDSDSSSRSSDSSASLLGSSIGFVLCAICCILFAI